MAFNMKRPIIKGTPLHKASMAKAKEAKSMVSQRRTRADSDLINAADDLGKSYSPKEQDYKLKSYDLSNIPEKKKKGKNNEKLTRRQELQGEYDKDHPNGTLFPDGDGGYKYYDAEGKQIGKKTYDKDGVELGAKKVLTAGEQAAKDAKKQTRKAKRKEVGKKLVDGVETVIGGVAMIPVAIGGGLFKLGEAIVNEFGDIVKDIKAKGVEGKERRKKANEKRVADNKLKKEEREFNTAEAVRIRAEEKEKKAAAKLEADKLKQAGLDKKQAEKLKKDKHKAKVKELKGYQKEKDAADKEAQRLKDIQMAKTFDEPVTTGAVVNAVGNEQMQQYTKEQRYRLQTEGVWSDEEEKMVLPEEIVDGEFVSKAEGTKLEPQELDYVDGKYVAKGSQDEKEVVEEKQTEGNNQTNNTVVEKTTTTPDRKPRPTDFEGTWKERQAQYKIANEEWYQAQQAKKGKSPVEMRDDRIYQFANKNGPVRKNMIKSGYKPQ